MVKKPNKKLLKRELEYKTVTFFGIGFHLFFHVLNTKIRLNKIFDPTTPVIRLVWALPASLATTKGIVITFFSSGY